MRNLTEDDLLELFAGQFFVTVKKGRQSLAGYIPPKMGCYLWHGQQTDYLNFLAAHRLQEHEAKAFDSHFTALGATPSFEILVIHGGDDGRLAKTIGSASNWLYDRFRLTVLPPRVSRIRCAAIRALAGKKSALAGQRIAGRTSQNAAREAMQTG